MEIFHCNACGHIPNFPGMDNRRYFFSNCSHILCGLCAGVGKGITAGVDGLKDHCQFCKAKCKMMELGANMGPELKMFFMDPTSHLQEAVKKAVLASNFHKVQLKSFNALTKRMGDHMKRMNEEYNKMKAQLGLIMNEVNETKQKNLALQQENQELNRKLLAMNSPCAPTMPGWPPGTPARSDGNCLNLFTTPEVRNGSDFFLSSLRTPRSECGSAADTPASRFSLGLPSPRHTLSPCGFSTPTNQNFNLAPGSGRSGIGGQQNMRTTPSPVSCARDEAHINANNMMNRFRSMRCSASSSPTNDK